MGKHQSEAPAAKILAPATHAAVALSGDTVFISPERAQIRWKGTKMRGAGKHEGEISLKKGFLLFREGHLQGGVITVDMHTISVTDIPEHEPIPRQNLLRHLKDPDFFAVDTYPEANFVITTTEVLSTGRLLLGGELTIKGISRPIEVSARQQGQRFSTAFTFDRLLWNIAYTGSWADKTLVDRGVELSIELQLE